MTNIFFSEFFSISPTDLEDAGLLDVSLVTDLPVFIDPFLLFNSDKPEYRQLHAEIIKYMIFLRDLTQSGPLSRGIVDNLFSFKEVKQNWLGYSKVGNSGRGLGRDFARALHINFNGAFRSFGTESISRASHLEKLCLIRAGVGRDTISDFTTNLIKGYLAERTESFAKRHLSPAQRRRVAVPKVTFDYQTQSWSPKVFELPFIFRDYVLLTPKDILTKDEAWINRADLVEQFIDIAASIPDAELRAQLNAYLARALAEEDKMTKKERDDAISLGIQKFPALLDFYILDKELNGAQASSLARQRLAVIQKALIDNVRQIVANSLSPSGFYELHSTTHAEARDRLLFLKDMIENKGCHRIFYVDGKALEREADVQVLFRLTWFGTSSVVSREVNDGRGPVDFMASRGARDKTLIEFKLASNSQLERNLAKQVPVYERASDPTHASLKAIVYFSERELDRVTEILARLKLQSDPNIILIDARSDNKPPGSKA